jgi:hypothetical protein
VLLYKTNEVISKRKASLAFKSTTSFIDKPIVEWMYKDPRHTFVFNAAKYWSSAGDQSTHLAVDFMKDIFNRNVDVKTLLGEDYEDLFIHPKLSANQLIYEDAGKGSLLRQLTVMDMRALCPKALGSSRIIEVCGQIFMDLRKEVYKNTAAHDIFPLPPDSFYKALLTYDILTPHHGDSSKCDQIKAIQVSKMNCTNKPGVEDVVIPHGTRHVVCPFMRADWSGVGSGHAAYLAADLKDHTIVSYDSNQEDMSDYVTALQFYLLQYSMRGDPALEYSVTADTEWTVCDVSKHSFTQSGSDCVYWSLYMMFCHFMGIKTRPYFIPTCKLKYCSGASWGWSGCGLINDDVSTMSNNLAHGEQVQFIDRWRLILAYLVSRLSLGTDNVSLIVPSLRQISADFEKAANILQIRLQEVNNVRILGISFL